MLRKRTKSSSGKTTLPRLARWRGAGRPAGEARAPPHAATRCPTPSCRARPIRMAVSPCIVSTAIWRKADPTRRSCSGALGSSGGPSVPTGSWQRIAAAMTGGPTKSKTSALAFFTPHGMPRSQVLGSPAIPTRPSCCLAHSLGGGQLIRPHVSSSYSCWSWCA